MCGAYIEALRRMRHADQCSRRCFGEYPVHYPVHYPMQCPGEYPVHYPVHYPEYPEYPMPYPVPYPMQYREYESCSLQVQSNRSSPPRRPR